MSGAQIRPDFLLVNNIVNVNLFAPFLQPCDFDLLASLKGTYEATNSG
jgi:hypothetical protein